jgi:acetyl-CoA carboxylase biotin carboxylase subunit
MRRLHGEIPRQAPPHRDPGAGRRQGNAVHLGERDCSLQRRHQKVWEEALSPLNEEQRKQIGEICAAAMRKLKYRGVGTIEFLYEDGEFYFIEMNTRLQVEHPVTEMITGIDLVNEQIRVASGAGLSVTQDDITFRATPSSAASMPRIRRPSPLAGHHHSLPPAGRTWRARRFGVYQGYKIPPYYDSLIGKLIVHGRNAGRVHDAARRCA